MRMATCICSDTFRPRGCVEMGDQLFFLILFPQSIVFFSIIVVFSP